MKERYKSTRLGDLLVEQGAITSLQLRQAIQLQQRRRSEQPREPQSQELGQILVELGFIDRSQLKSSLNWQRRLRKTTAVMVFIAPLFTAACGGGGGGSSPAPTQQKSSQSSLVVSSTSNSPSSAPSSSSLSSSSSSVFGRYVDGPVELYWTTPTERENGDALDVTEIGGYELRYKREGESEYTVITIEDGYADAYYLDFLKGQYLFEIATYDIHGLYSSFVPINPS